MGPLAANPISVKFDYSDILIISEPGDTVTHIIKYNFINGSYSAQVLYSQSGLNQVTWDRSKFHFQPDKDTSSLMLHYQVMTFVPQTMQMTDTFYIDKRLAKLNFPSTNYGQNINLIWADTTQPAWVYSYFLYDYSMIDSFQAGYAPGLFVNDFRCPIGIEEYDDSKIEMKVYPNPTTNEFNLTMSGLICGRNYKMDIIEIDGSVKYQTVLRAKTSTSISMDDLSPGIYFLRLHTQKGYVVQKIIKM